MVAGDFILLSVAGIVAIWVYRQPLTDEANRRLGDIDLQLIQAQGTLDSSQKELERALRIVDSAQAGLDKIKAQTNSTGNFMQTIQSTLNDKLLPDLQTTRSRIDSAKATLQQFQSFRAYQAVEEAHARDIAAGPIEACNKTISDWVDASRKDDRHRCSR